MKLGDLVVHGKEKWKGKVIWTNDTKEFVKVVKISPESVRGDSTVVPVGDIKVVERSEKSCEEVWE